MSNKEDRKRQGKLAIIGGCLLIIGGLHASIMDIRKLILVAINEGLINPFIASIIITFLLILGFLAGVPIIIGGLLHYNGKSKFIANALISFGSGISIVDLFSFMMATGPAFKAYLLSTKVQELTSISAFYLVIIIGLSLSFLALFVDPIAMILGLTSAILTSISGSIVEVIVITTFLAKIGLIKPSPLVINLMRILLLSGVIFLLSGYLAGIGKYRLALIVTSLALMFNLILLIVLGIGTLIIHLSPIKLILSIIGEIIGVILLIYVKISLKK